MSIDILHITAHMGGGAGKAISGLAISDEFNKHRILLLEKPQKLQHVQRCRDHGILVDYYEDVSDKEELLRKADIIVLSWWAHPLMAKFLADFPQIKTHMVLWSHVNGCYYPILKENFVSQFDALMFTSSLSYENPEWNEAVLQSIHEKSHIVYGIGDLQPEHYPHKQSYDLSDYFKIGYTGTISYSKLHPQFVEYCKAVIDVLPEVRFIMAGDPAMDVLMDIESAGLIPYFEFRGFVENIPELLIQCDVFGYLLNPENFATSENSLLEAMAAALPIIVLNGDVERHIIKNGKNGVVVSGPDEYAKSIKELWENVLLRQRLGQNALNYLIETYRIEKNLQCFNAALKMSLDKSSHEFFFSDYVGHTPFEWFLACCPLEEQILFTDCLKSGNLPDNFSSLQKHIYFEKSKSSPFHYLHFYPQDRRLQKLCACLSKESDKYERKKRYALL